MYQRYGKRCLDVILSLIALIVLSPLFLLIALAIRLDSPGGVIFSQKRVGMHKKLFSIYKFRTMRSDTPHDVPTNDLAGSTSYITPVGRFLRMTSLDELPQLWNILKGEMSLIGPRPALWNQYDLIALRDQYGANDVRPGLSGWAQVNGRDYLSRDLEKKARRDGEYAQHITFWFDLKCFLLTIVKVINRQGIAEGAEGKDEKSGSADSDHTNEKRAEGQP